MKVFVIIKEDGTSLSLQKGLFS